MVSSFFSGFCWLDSGLLEYSAAFFPPGFRGTVCAQVVADTHGTVEKALTASVQTKLTPDMVEVQSTVDMCCRRASGRAGEQSVRDKFIDLLSADISSRCSARHG